jgi:hypothetical protein
MAVVKSLRSSFIDGLARTLDIHGARSKLADLARIDPLDTSELAGDWQAVGGDFRAAVDALLEQSPAKKPQAKR